MKEATFEVRAEGVVVVDLLLIQHYQLGSPKQIRFDRISVKEEFIKS